MTVICNGAKDMTNCSLFISFLGDFDEGSENSLLFLSRRPLLSVNHIKITLKILERETFYHTFRIRKSERLSQKSIHQV